MLGSNIWNETTEAGISISVATLGARSNALVSANRNRMSALAWTTSFAMASSFLLVVGDAGDICELGA